MKKLFLLAVAVLGLLRNLPAQLPTESFWAPATHSGYWLNGQEWQIAEHDSVLVRLLYAGRHDAYNTWLLEVYNRKQSPLTVAPEEIRFVFLGKAEPGQGQERPISKHCPAKYAVSANVIYRLVPDLHWALYYFLDPCNAFAEGAPIGYGYFSEMALFRHTLAPGESLRRLVFSEDCRFGPPSALDVVVFLAQRDYVLRFERQP